jgi:hypothetical protein
MEEVLIILKITTLFNSLLVGVSGVVPFASHSTFIHPLFFIPVSKWCYPIEEPSTLKKMWNFFSSIIALIKKCILVIKNLDVFVFLHSFFLLSSILGSCSRFTSSTMIFDNAFFLFMEIVHRVFIHRGGGGCGGGRGRGLRLR